MFCLLHTAAAGLLPLSFLPHSSMNDICIDKHKGDLHLRCIYSIFTDNLKALELFYRLYYFKHFVLVGSIHVFIECDFHTNNVIYL